MDELVYLCVPIVSLYALYWWLHRDFWILGDSFPGPRWLPFIGNVFEFSRDLVKSFKTSIQLFDKYGPVVRGWLGPFQLYIALKDPEIVRQVLSNSNVTDHDFVISQVGKWIKGVVTLDGQDWKRRRKQLEPAFHRMILETYVEIFSKKGKILISKLGEITDGDTFDVFQPLGLCALDVLSETIIGVEGNAQETADTSALESLAGLNQVFIRKLLYPWLLVDWICNRTSDGRKLISVMNKLRSLSENVIKQKLELYKNGIRQPGMLTSNGKRINSFLDIMIAASEDGKPILSPENLRDEVITLYLAGADTVALTMSYFLILIAIHTDIQEQLHDEVVTIFGDNQRDVTLDDINKMVILERVIKETMRLFPPGVFSTRRIPENIRLSNGKTIPKGCAILICYYHMHRDEANFKDAKTFWPDRWLPENSVNRHPYAYLPFAGGHRVCMGRQYAMMQLKCVLSQIIRNYHVTTRMTEKDLTDNLKFGITLHLAEKLGGYRIQIQKREQWK